MLLKYLRKRSSIGIDINEKHIALVELQQKGQNIRLARADCYPSDIVQENGAFKSNKPIYTAISSQYVIQKNLSFNEKNNKKAIQLLLATHQHDYFPGIQEKLLFDFTYRKSQQNTCVFAVREADLLKRLQRLEHVGIYPFCIEPDSHAFIRIMHHIKRTPLTDNKIALLCIPSHNPHFILFNDTDILYEQTQNSLINEEINCVQTLQNIPFSFPHHHLEEIYILGTDDLPWTKQLSRIFNLSPIFIDPFQHLFHENLPFSAQLFLSLGLALRGEIDGH